MPDNAWIGGTSTVWSLAANWFTGSVPVTGDTVTFDGRAQRNLDGFDASAVTLAALRVYSSFLKRIGTNDAGVVTPLKVGATLCDIGLPGENGSNSSGGESIGLDFAAIQTTCNLHASRNSGQNGFSCVMIRGTHASNKFNVKAANVGFGTVAPGESVVLSQLDVGKGALVTVGYGATATTINQTDGDAVLLAAATTINQLGGTMTTRGTGAITTVNAGGKFVSNSTGTITTITAMGNGEADFSQSPVARTVTNARVDGPGAKFNADNGAMRTGSVSLTLTNGVICQNGAKSNQVNLGQVTLSAA